MVEGNHKTDTANRENGSRLEQRHGKRRYYKVTHYGYYSRYKWLTVRKTVGRKLTGRDSWWFLVIAFS